MNEYLEAVKTYVGSTSAKVPLEAEWEVNFDANREIIAFRLADRSKVPFRGLVVEMDAVEIGMTRAEVIGELAGQVFVNELKQGLPIKQPGKAYETVFCPPLST